MSFKDKPGDNGPEMDEIDLAFQASVVPDGCVPMGFVAAFMWMDPDGSQCWRVYSQIDAPITQTLGLLEIAKLELLARTDTGLPIRYSHLDEDDD